jgi:K+-transporting ATPase KdpF subunit
MAGNALISENTMSALYWIVGIIALVLMVYLFVALLKPEKF